MSDTPEPSFLQQVETAAKDAGVVEAPVETPPPSPESSAPEGSPDEPAAPVAPKPEEPPPPKQTVPLAVHIQQREQHQREMREMREQFEVGNKRLAELYQRLQPPPAPPIDPETDPLGAALAKLDVLDGAVKQVAESTAEDKRTEALRQQIRQFEQAVVEDERAYGAEVPDLKQAMQYAKDTKFREYVALGLSAKDAAARVQQDAYALAGHAFQNGFSPSHLVYEMAKALGYKPGSATSATPPQNTPERDENGRFASDAEKTVEMRAAGAERAKGGGGSPENLGPLTLQQLATMDNDEFAKMTSGSKWKKLMGG